MTTTKTRERATQTEGKAAAEPTASKIKDCQCLAGTGKQCDGKTTKAFARGHDARMASRLAQAVAEGKTTEAAASKLIREAGGGELLVGKMVHSAALRTERKSAPPKANTSGRAASKPTGTKASKAGSDESKVEGNPMGKKVQVSHGKRKYDAVVIRDAGGELRARHRLQGKNCDHELDLG